MSSPPRKGQVQRALNTSISNKSIRDHTKHTSFQSVKIYMNHEESSICQNLILILNTVSLPILSKMYSKCNIANTLIVSFELMFYAPVTNSVILGQFCFVCLFYCITSQLNSYGLGGTVRSPNHTFSWASLNKQLTSTLCTYLCL